ncbi:peptidase inhibitor family I36 protein [Streptomyces sp. Ru72]|uniref:peptidase inhibitor family I36 protein n=1 Tax=Streptomyces sp. Ru72 TaxID=2080747 RepID=UPI0021566636|nr:peptidase inhibitor family I36 protein [Streptomyces sp. Ru72]
MPETSAYTTAPHRQDCAARRRPGCPGRITDRPRARPRHNHCGPPAVARDQITCPRGFVYIYPDIDFNGQPYVKRAVDGSVRHLPDYIRSKGSSIINNSSRTARVYQKDNYFGRHVCVGREGGTISDLRSYQLNDTTHSLRNNDTPCGAT